MAGNRQYHIDSAFGYGGGKLPTREWREITISRPQPATEFYIIIYQSMGDERVLTDIIAQYQTLVDQNFHPIIAVRDVFPLPRTDIPDIRSDFAQFIPRAPIIPELVLQIMEIEAWFIGEYTHFPRISATLTLPAVVARLGYDPSTIDVSNIPGPSSDLRSVYALANLGYNKSKTHADRTVSVLSYEDVYIDLRQRVSELDRLVQLIEDFFMRR